MCRICVRNGESPQKQNIKFDQNQHKPNQVILSEDEYNSLSPLDFSAKPYLYQEGMYTPTKKYPAGRDFLRQISTVFCNFLKKYLRYREVIYLIGKPSFSAFRRSKDIRCGYPHKIATPL